MAKPEVISLLKKTFQSAQEMITPLTDAQCLEPVKFPFGDRTVTRATFWQGPLYHIRTPNAQPGVFLRVNEIGRPTPARRPACGGFPERSARHGPFFNGGPLLRRAPGAGAPVR